MLAKLLIIAGLASAGLLLLLLNITTPASAGALGILGVFLLSYIIVTSLMTFCVWFLEKLFRKLLSGLSITHRASSFTLKKAYYYASVIALAPVIILSLQSVGGAGIYEVLLVLFLVVLGCVYIAKRSR